MRDASLLTPDALVANPVAPGGQDADPYIRPDLFRGIFAADQSRDTAAVMAATQRPALHGAASGGRDPHCQVSP